MRASLSEQIGVSISPASQLQSILTYPHGAQNAHKYAQSTAQGTGSLAVAPSSIGEERKAVGWNHVRLSVVVPIGVIVAVAIVCVVVAVLSSAQRADEVALDTERQLFTRALANHGERVLREIESVATSERADRKIRAQLRSPTGCSADVGRGCNPSSTTTSSSWPTPPTA